MTRNNDAEGDGMGCLLVIFLVVIAVTFLSAILDQGKPDLQPMIQRCATDKEPPAYCTELIKKIAP